MIKLDVKEYCHGCLDFSPDVIAPIRVTTNDNREFTFSDTIVMCEYRNRCENVKRYLLKQLEGEDA